MPDAKSIIEHLNLEPHLEGGHFRETFRDEAETDGRSASTAIFFLLQKDEISHWHRVDSVEVWHYYAGAPLLLTLADAQGVETEHLLGPDILKDQSPQVVVPKHVWQSAISQGDWTLVGCTVAPGFQFDGFELLEEGRHPREVADSK